MDFSFEEQREIFKKELLKAFDYIEFKEWHEARHRMYNANEIIDQDINTFMMFASYVGSLKRIAYYKYVHRQGFDVRALADAAILSLMFQGVYRFEFEAFLSKKAVKEELLKTRYPKWTRLGLVGGSTRDIIDLGNEFCEYMESLTINEDFTKQLVLF